MSSPEKSAKPSSCMIHSTTWQCGAGEGSIKTSGLHRIQLEEFYTTLRERGGGYYLGESRESSFLHLRTWPTCTCILKGMGALGMLQINFPRLLPLWQLCWWSWRNKTERKAHICCSGKGHSKLAQQHNIMHPAAAQPFKSDTFSFVNHVHGAEEHHNCQCQCYQQCNQWFQLCKQCKNVDNDN